MISESSGATIGLVYAVVLIYLAGIARFLFSPSFGHRKGRREARGMGRMTDRTRTSH